jgi:hypothetical protein
VQKQPKIKSFVGKFMGKFPVQKVVRTFAVAAIHFVASVRVEARRRDAPSPPSTCYIKTADADVLAAMEQLAAASGNPAPKAPSQTAP